LRTVQEKLEFFNEVILKDAIAERDKILDRLKAQEESSLNREEKKFREEADEMLKKEAADAENLKNSMIAKAVIDRRFQLIKARDEIFETVLNDVKAALREFVAGENYFPYLSRQIKKSCNMAGEGEIEVYISSDDMARFSSALENLRGELPPNTVFRETNDDIIGGCRAVNRTKGMVVNNTLSEKLRESMDDFYEICDLKIDLSR